MKHHLTGEFDNVWDAADQEKFCVLRDSYYIQVQCAKILFDVTSRVTYKNILTSIGIWYKYVKIFPSCFVATKWILTRGKLRKSIVFHQRRIFIQYCNISVKRKYNSEKLFLWLARKLIGGHNLESVAPGACSCPTRGRHGPSFGSTVWAWSRSCSDNCSPKGEWQPVRQRSLSPAQKAFYWQLPCDVSAIVCSAFHYSQAKHVLNL